MGVTADVAALGIAELRSRLDNGSLTVSELVEQLLRRISDWEPTLHAMVTVTAEKALREAAQADAELARGERRAPLHGIPYVLKDVIDLEGVPTTSCSRVASPTPAAADAHVAALLREGGAICLGKAVTHEFAIGGPSFDLAWPPARNPWNPSRHPGGSSSGCGAAVAAGYAPFAIGTDTGGSIRYPSSACGLVGLKPTYGLVSLSGVVPLAFSLDHVGPLARSVEDVAWVMEAIAGHDPRDPASVRRPGWSASQGLEEGVAGLRIGYIRHFHESDVPDCDPEVASAIDRAVSGLGDRGAIVENLAVRPLAEYNSTQSVVQAVEAYTAHRGELDRRGALYGALTRRRLLVGKSISGHHLLQAQRLRRVLASDFRDRARPFDAVVCVSSMDLPVRIDDAEGIERSYPRQARKIFNLLGLPAAVVPAGMSSQGLPLSVQIAARPFAEATVLRVARVVERIVDLAGDRPSLPVG